MKAYFIVDDVISERGVEGYEVMYGDPYEATGFKQSQHSLMREALASIPHGETVYRVFLARRHGKGKFVRIRA